MLHVFCILVTVRTLARYQMFPLCSVRLCLQSWLHDNDPDPLCVERRTVGIAFECAQA
jgi:hypothetical protein